MFEVIREMDIGDDKPIIVKAKLDEFETKDEAVGYIMSFGFWLQKQLSIKEVK